MKSQDISRFTTDITGIGGCNDNTINLLPSINLLATPQHQSILGDMSINFFKLSYSKNNLSNPISSNSLYNPIGNHNYLSDIGGNIGLFPKLTETISPLRFGNNNFSLKLSRGIDNANLSSFSANSNALGLTLNSLEYNQLSVTNKTKGIDTWNILGGNIDCKTKGLSIHGHYPVWDFSNPLYKNLQGANSSLNSINRLPLMYHEQDYLKASSKIFPSSLLSLNAFKENSLSFEPLLYPNYFGVSLNNMLTKETACYLEKNCITEISANNRDVKLVFKHSTHSFRYDARLSRIRHIVELSEQDIASYNQLIIKNNHKQNQGKGGVNKRKDEKVFFLAKFKELRGLDQKSRVRDIVHKIWDEYKGKELSKLSKARGMITLMGWYREYIAKSA